MTFHGTPRATADVMHHVHESPNVMLVPLYLLAVGALFAGFIFHDYFIGDHYEAFWKTALFTLPGNHILHDIHEVPILVKLAPFVAMIAGFGVAYQFYIRQPGNAEGGRGAPPAFSTISCSTSGTSTSSTTSFSSSRRSASAISCGSAAMAG